MSPRTKPVRPPRVAACLVALFTSYAGAESIEGDLLEEFSQLAAKSGVDSARRWYWRQAGKTIPYLIGAAFRTAPWTIAGVVIGAFFFRWYFSRWSNPAVQTAIEAVLERYRVFERDPQAYIFWLTHLFLLERLIVNMWIGTVVGLAARGREMAAAIALALVGDILAIQATWMTFSRTGDQGLLWTLPWSFAFSIGIVVGAAIVRMHRSSTMTRASAG